MVAIIRAIKQPDCPITLTPRVTQPLDLRDLSFIIGGGAGRK